MKNPIKNALTSTVLFSVLVFYASVSNGSSVTGKIDYVLPHVGNQVFFNMVGFDRMVINDQNTNGRCITVDTGNFRVDLSQPAANSGQQSVANSGQQSNETGPAIYAALLAAQAQNRTITVFGTNSCTSGRENVNWVLVR